MSESTLGVILWVTIIVGWVGFLVIMGALLREAYGWVRSRSGDADEALSGE